MKIEQLTKSPGVVRRSKCDLDNPPNKILSRNRHLSGPIPTSSLGSTTREIIPDRRWLSSEHLVEPWVVEDRWWLSNRCEAFLDTDSRVFGRKKIFLVDRKKGQNSESDIGATETETFKTLVGSSPAI